MRRSLLLLSALLAATTTNIFAQQRWHIKPTAEEIEYRQKNPKPIPITRSEKKSTASTFTMPADARIPGEFEESQAVAISWVDDWMNGGPDITTEYGDLWAKMADAIQKECPVWIRIADGADSNTIKTFMSSKGTPLTNYRFFVTVGDDFWMRDYGPISFYHGPNDDIGMLDLNYYPGRDLDNLFPGFLANELGYTDVKTNLYAEGGNFISDGFYKSFHSNVVESVNTNTTPKHSAWTLQQVRDTIKYVWASKDVVSTPTLVCDGGTGHNDMFMKLMDENTFIVMEYPSSVSATDRSIINNVINTLTTMKTTYGKPYRIFKMPMPKQDDNSYLSSCGDINDDARTFVNGTTVNGTYLMPTYSDATSGDRAGELAAIELFKRAAPGYKVVPLDSRMLTILGGAIHCINMQIPAENPITIWHPPVIDLQPKLNSYHIVSKANNKSGIASAKCVWRVKGTPDWKTVTLTDSAGYYVGDIKGSFKLLADDASIEYYISASSNNGKTITKPIVAGNGGYYTFYFAASTSAATLDPVRNFALNAVPNPNNGSFYIPVSFDRQMEVTAYVTDVVGKKIATVNFGRQSDGMSKLEFDLAGQAAGMYFIQITADGQLLDTKRIMKQ